MTADIEREVGLSKRLFVWPQIGMDSWDLGLNAYSGERDRRFRSIVTGRAA